MQFDIELIQHEYFCKCNFLKIIAISKWSGYVLFEFNPLVMVHSLSIQCLSRASNVKCCLLSVCDLCLLFFCKDPQKLLDPFHEQECHLQERQNGVF